MKMTHKLDLLMKERHLNKRQLSMQAHIPYTTISSFYDKGTENVKLSTLKTLASFFNVSLDYIADDSVTDRYYGKSINFKIGLNEMNHIKKYRNLDDHGKKMVDFVLNEETERMNKEAKNETPVIELRRYFAPVSAGTGVELEPYENFENIEVYSNAYTRRASFCLTVRGDSMEPRFHNDDIIMVAELEDVEFVDIGVFIVDGQGYLKIRGEYGLVSLNPAYDNIHVSYEQMNRAIGKVIGVLDPDWIKNN